MKKLLSFILITFVLSTGIYATGEQKLYDYDSKESIYTRFLCDYAGVTGPSSSYPITGEELMLALERVDRSKLEGSVLAVYDSLLDALAPSDDTLSWDPRIEVSPQIFLTDGYSGKTDIGGRNSFFLPFREEKPSLTAGIGLSFGKNVFIEGEIIAKNSPLKDGILLTSFDWLVNYRDGNFNLMGSNSTGMVAEVPYLARGSFGNSWFNLTLGRTPHRMGSGFTGNMTIGDNFDYQELFELSFFSRYFTYNISVTHFDRQTSKYEFANESFSGKQQSRVVHRFDINLWDRVRAAINFSTLYYSDTSLDFRWLNPFMIAHNYYNYDENPILAPGDEANNINSFELEWNIGHGWKTSAQFVLDQFQTFFEDQDSLPMAYGVMANVSWSGTAGENLITAWAEGVYTNPYLYCNEKVDKVEKTPAVYDESGNLIRPAEYEYVPNYNYDYMLGYHRRGWQASSIGYTGYPLGPDSIAAAMGVNVVDMSHSLEYGAEIIYSVHGEKGFDSPNFDGDYKASTPTGEQPEHRLKISGQCKWNALDGKLDVFAGTGLSCFWNFRNTDRTRIAPEAYVGLTWNIL